MTLDEAIAHAREVAKEQKSKYDKCPTRTRYNCAMCFHNPKCDEDAKEHEQLAEWLEELKAYRQYIDLTEIPEQYKLGFQDGIIAGNNKAVDDFYNKIIEAYEEMKNIPQVEKATVHTIALGIMEQLKNKNLAR